MASFAGACLLTLAFTGSPLPPDSVQLAAGSPATPTAAPPTAPAESATVSPAAGTGALGTGREPLRSAWHGVRSLGSDAWYIASSPARLDRRGVAWVAGTVLVTAVLHANDGPIQRAVQRNRGNAVFDAVRNTGDALEPLGYMKRTVPWYVGAMGIGYAFGNQTLTMVPAQILESHVLAGGLRNLGRAVVGRSRPFENRGPDSFEFGGGTSFPSGHTSIAFELATVVSEHAHRWPVTAVSYALATTMAIQRVDSNNHWASDLVVPAVAGTFIARTVVHRTSERHDWAVLPSFAPGDAPGLQVVVAF